MVLNAIKRWVTVGWIVVLSLAFIYLLGWLDEPTPEEIVAAFIPVIIALLILGHITIKEIQTPGGFKLILDSLSKHEVMDTVSESADTMLENDVLEIEEAEPDESSGRNSVEPDGGSVAEENNRKKITDKKIDNIILYLHRSKPALFEFNIDNDYGEEIDLFMRAIVEDELGTVRYILLTKGPNNTFEGLIKLSRTYRNGTLLHMMDDISSMDTSNEAGQWEGLANPEIVNKAGVLTKSHSVSIDSTCKDALRKMKETNNDHLPVLDKNDEFVGVVSQEKIIRNILLETEAQ